MTPSKTPKPPVFGLKKRLEKEYEAAIGKIVTKVLPPKLAEQTLDEWLAEIAAASQRADVQRASEILARKMVQRVDAENSRTWREAAQKSQQSRRLWGFLQKEMQGSLGVRVNALIRQNAAYIKSIPLQQATMFVDEVRKAQQSGARASTIAKMARQRFPALLASRVRLISRTETAKASTALTQARCEDLNIDFYQWLTSEDVRVRDSHKKMNDVIVPWSQPPDPEALIGEKSTLGHYHSGASPNCRCSVKTILTLDDITFPARVYWNGAIHTMTKPQFKQIAVGLESRAA
jgi:SPP1 gp7 family putative phage head morphogenesis protein